MASPPPILYSVGYSFSAFEAVNPSTPKPGLALDESFGAVAVSVNSAIAALQDVRRADGALNNGLVTMDTLSAAVVAMLGSKFNPRGLWLTATAYAVGDLVKAPDTLAGTYVCGIAHTSGTFATDKTAGKWLVLNASDSGAANIAVPSPASGDTGKWLYATGAANPTWQPLSNDFTTIGNGLVGTPSLAFAADATTGFYSPGAAQIGFTVSGARQMTLIPGALVMQGANVLSLGRDGSGNSWIRTTPGESNINGTVLTWASDTSGNVTQAVLQTDTGSATWTGSLFTLQPATPGTLHVTMGIQSSSALLDLCGGNAAITFREASTAAGNRWTIQFNAANDELAFVPYASAYNMRFTPGGWGFFGPQTSQPSSSGGVSTWDCYVQGTLKFGQNGSATNYIDHSGNGTLHNIAGNAFAVNALTVNSLAAATSTSPVAPTGSVVEVGPIYTQSGTPSTLDVGTGYVLVGIRNDGSLGTFLRGRLLTVT